MWKASRTLPVRRRGGGGRAEVSCHYLVTSASSETCLPFSSCGMTTPDPLPASLTHRCGRLRRGSPYAWELENQWISPTISHDPTIHPGCGRQIHLLTVFIIARSPLQNHRWLPIACLMKAKRHLAFVAPLSSSISPESFSAAASLRLSAF